VAAIWNAAAAEGAGEAADVRRCRRRLWRSSSRRCRTVDRASSSETARAATSMSYSTRCRHRKPLVAPLTATEIRRRPANRRTRFPGHTHIQVRVKVLHTGSVCPQYAIMMTRMSSVIHHRVKKVKASHTRYRALGPELIPAYR